MVNGISDVNLKGIDIPVLSVYKSSEQFTVEVLDLDRQTGIFMSKRSLEEIADDIKKHTKMVFIPRDEYDPINLVGSWV